MVQDKENFAVQPGAPATHSCLKLTSRTFNNNTDNNKISSKN